MELILHDSSSFSKLKKTDQTRYVETVVGRMIDKVGQENTDSVLFECGAQCCGKSWTGFVKRIWDESTSIDDFFNRLNEEEAQYNTEITYSSDDNIITVERSKCICGLINNGLPFETESGYCMCSNGHMSVFFNAIFSVKDIQLEKSISSGAKRCRWKIEIEK